MRIHLCGAAGEVTGSGYLVEHGGRRVLVDFGQFQGTPGAIERSRSLGPVDPGALDAVLLTHAHLDHVGRLPLLVRGDGAHAARWSLYATAATIELAEIILEDSARLQAADAERSRERAAPGEPLVEPLFTADDSRRVLERAKAVPYGEWIEILPGWRARWRDAGHILGSASIELRAGGHRIVFGGDIGPSEVPILRNPDPPKEADLVFLESTYGDRDHRPFEKTLEEFGEIITSAAWEKAKVLIPAFAVGRTQLILECLARIHANGRVPKVPVWLDSPMALRAGEVFHRHHGIMDAQAQALRRSGELERDLSELRLIRSGAESRALNDSWDPGIIIAGSGMCDGGRILHHLRHHVWRRGVQVVLCGFMARGTLGWQLLTGAAEVRLFGRWVPVRAAVHTLGGFSAHAGQGELLAWLAPMVSGGAGPSTTERSPSPPRVVLIHGEDPQRLALAARIRDRFGIDAERPGPGAVIEP